MYIAYAVQPMLHESVGDMCRVSVHALCSPTINYIIGNAAKPRPTAQRRPLHQASVKAQEATLVVNGGCALP